MFELTLAFLATPSKPLWASECLKAKRALLELAFSDRLAYPRKPGFRAPKPTMPLKTLDNPHTQNCEMARPGGFEPPAFGTGIQRSIHTELRARAFVAP